MCRIWRDLHAGEFICDQVDLVDQHRQALRADIFRFVLECQMQQRHPFIGAIAIQTAFFVLFGHVFSFWAISLLVDKLAGSKVSTFKLLNPFNRPAIHEQHYTGDE